MGLEVFNPFAGLLGEKQQQDSWRWGTVVATDPLRVQLDGDSTPLITPPDTLVPVLTGDRVRVHVHNRRATIMGRTTSPSYPSPNIVTINGTPYALSGTATVAALTWSEDSNSVYYATLHQPIPYDPPSGWTFVWSVLEAAAWVFVSTSQRLPSGGTQAIRVIQIANSRTNLLTRLSWQLVRA